MQDIDEEALRIQRRRRKRIARMKTGIILVISGWILISMILIICLLVRMSVLEHRIQILEQKTTTASVSDGTGSEAVAEPETEVTEAETETQQSMIYAAPEITGTDDADNMAEPGDVHKVYLTFDNGPSENTAEILDILDRYGVKATFFVVGSEAEEAQEIYKRIVEDGHTLGMHSFCNKYSVIYQSTDSFAEDYEKLHDYLYEVTGEDSIYYRFPGGSSNQISNVSMANFIHYLNEQGVTYFDWNVSAGDAVAAYTAEEIVENVTADVVKYKTSVVLLHDAADNATTAEALGPLIEALQAMGAEILPIDEDTQVIQAVKAESVK
ncbi:MAG: polysaccharide deacetylase family protein [Roseburia sp.]